METSDMVFLVLVALVAVLFIFMLYREKVLVSIGADIDQVVINSSGHSAIHVKDVEFPNRLRFKEVDRLRVLMSDTSPWRNTLQKMLIEDKSRRVILTELTDTTGFLVQVVDDFSIKSDGNESEA
jgi:hypothetical protein